MAWTDLTRRQHARTGGRYASDLTAAEGAIIEPLMLSHTFTGRPRKTDLAPCVRCAPLHCDNRLPVAAVAERLSTGFDGAGVFSGLAH